MIGKSFAAGLLSTALVLAPSAGGPTAASAQGGAVDVAAEAAAPEPWSGQGASFTSTERLDGTFANPILGSDVPDVSTIRVSAEDAGEPRDVYYMVSTTMELAPGVPILKSYDLVNWEIVSYAWGVLDTRDDAALRNGRSSYGQGQWASTIAFHEGTYYVIHNSNNTGRSYLFWTDDIEDGRWQRSVYPAADRFHDPSLYFDGDTPYVFYGAADTSVARLSPDLKTVEQKYAGIITPDNFVNESGYTKQEFGAGWEGFQIYKVRDWYYALAISWGRFGRQAVVFRSKNLLGAAAGAPYAGRIAIGTKAIAQGSFVSTRPDGLPDQALVFADDFPTGRIPVLVPVTWSDDPDAWPAFGNGVAGEPSQVEFPGSLPVPVRLTAAERRRAMSDGVVASDDFDNDAQHRDWNHPDPGPVVPPVPPGEPVGTEAVVNGGFEDAAGPAPWTAREGATVRVVTTDAASGTAAAEVTGRTTTGSGIHQDLAVDPGSTYRVSFKVRTIDEAAATTTFIASVDYGAPGPSGQAQWVNLASGSVPRDEWTTVTGTFTVPTDRPVDQFRLYVENPWAPSPTPAQRPSFLLDDVSVVKTAVPGEVWDPQEDAYNGSDLALQWQWNHNPDNRYWSLTDRPGWLRLVTGHVTTGQATAQFHLTRFEEARNTLSQRTFAPTSSAETRMDVSGMNDGDTAGLAVYNRQVSYIGVRDVGDVRVLGTVSRPAQPFQRTTPIDGAEDFKAQVELPDGTGQVWLKADLDLRKSGPTSNTVQFLYSLDGTTWRPLGEPYPKLAQWEQWHFKGQRFGLFNYATQTTGGTVDFDYYALSDTLTSEGLPVDTTDLDWLLDEAALLDPADYTATSWAAVATARAKAEALTDPSTQNQVDAVAQPLNQAIASLVPADAPEPSPTTVHASPTTMVYGRPATVRVRVTGADSGQVTAVLPDGRQLTAPVQQSGVAGIALPRRSLRPGRHALAVHYGGTEDHAPSSATAVVRVVKAATRVRASVPRAVEAGGALAVRVRVGADGVVPAGPVRVVLEGTRRAVVRPLVDGRATVRVVVPRRTDAGRAEVLVHYGGSALCRAASVRHSVRVTR